MWPGQRRYPAASLTLSRSVYCKSTSMRGLLLKMRWPRQRLKLGRTLGPKLNCGSCPSLTKLLHSPLSRFYSVIVSSLKITYFHYYAVTIHLINHTRLGVIPARAAIPCPTVCFEYGATAIANELISIQRETDRPAWHTNISPHL